MRETNRHLVQSIKQEILSNNQRRHGSYEQARELDVIQAGVGGAAVAADPYIQDMARSVVAEARRQGVSINEVRQKLSGSDAAGPGWFQSLSGALGAEQRRGFFYGIGAVVLAAMIWPFARQSFRSLAVQSMEGGMELADRARSVVCRAREEIEDIVAEARFKNLQEEDQPYCSVGIEEENRQETDKEIFH